MVAICTAGRHKRLKEEERMSKKKVLFLCTGNSARSQMAEGLLRHYAGDRFEALSAGLEPRGVNPLAVKVMEEVGIDISHQTSKGIDKFLGKETIHYAVFVCANAEEKCPSIYNLALNRLSWRMEDPDVFEGPEEEKLAKFRAARDELDRRIKEWLAGQEPQTV
jgi:arsenate reductase (thioredoxin)